VSKQSHFERRNLAAAALRGKVAISDTDSARLDVVVHEAGSR
jgi:hypothetical protein